MSTPSPSPQRHVIARHPWWTAFGLLLCAIAALLLLWDWNWFKGPVERRVQAATGRAFAIGGDLDVDLGRVTTIRADRLRLANVPWSKQPDMATLDRLELRIEPWPLISRREVRIPEIRLVRPRVVLESGAKGANNWTFPGSGDGQTPRLKRIWIDDGQLRYLDPGRKTDIDIKIASVQPRRDPAAAKQAAPPIAVEGGGKWSNNRFTLSGRAESPLELQNTDQPYSINLHAAAGATRAQARGKLINPFQLEGFDLRFALSGKNLADLYPLIGVAIPPTPPYALDGRLRHEKKLWKYEGFTGKVGDSDLSGSASVATGGARPFLRANLLSRRLDFDDLAGFVGGAPQAKGTESTNPELQALASKQAASPRLLPDTPYALDKLRAMDADVTLKAQRINAPSLPIDDMDAHLFLADGVLRLDPLNFGVADGEIRSRIRMNAREAAIRTRADISARGLNLSKLMPDAKLAEDAIGKIGGKIAVDTRGNSIAKMLGSADGDISVGMGKGQISKLLMKLAGLNLGGALRTKLVGDKPIPIRCAYGDFAVRNGVMNTRALAFDTTDTVVTGTGTISLREETLDLTMRPKPKVRSLLSLRAPLYVGGTFKNPTFKPDYVRIGLRGAAAVALGVIAPPAALLATTELGGGKDVDCGDKAVTR
ncbi:AsmA family protein [Luteimonas aquatica]|uniref:AsmA family protein n=1 Tax=Luteimonas aquatica TaxID=450364 RepID=UPI001F580849|nr:AsmA family protein [Luteimonas aquatica]